MVDVNSEREIEDERKKEDRNIQIENDRKKDKQIDGWLDRQINKLYGQISQKFKIISLNF